MTSLLQVSSVGLSHTARASALLLDWGCTWPFPPDQRQWIHRVEKHHQQGEGGVCGVLPTYRFISNTIVPAAACPPPGLCLFTVRAFQTRLHPFLSVF